MPRHKDAKGGFNPLENRLESGVLKSVAVTGLEDALRQEGVRDDIIQNCLTREEHDSEGERERREQIGRLFIHKLINERHVFGERAISFIREPFNTNRKELIELLVKCNKDSHSDTKDYFVLSIRVMDPERAEEAINGGEQSLQMRPVVRYYPAHQEKIAQIHNVPYVTLSITLGEINAMYSLWEDEGWKAVTKPELEQQGVGLLEQARKNLLTLQNNLSRAQRLDDSSHVRHIRESLPRPVRSAGEVEVVDISPQVDQRSEAMYEEARQTLQNTIDRQEQLAQRARRKSERERERKEARKRARRDERKMLRETHRQIDRIMQAAAADVKPGSELVQEVLDINERQKRFSQENLPLETIQDLIRRGKQWWKNRKKR